MITEQLDFLSKLISCKSITPADAGSMDLIMQKLESLGFKCHKVVFSGDEEEDTANLYAEYGRGKKNLCFAGHSDVVHPGNIDSWQHNPFDVTVVDERVYGRGAVDMKGAISSFIFAIEQYIKQHKESSEKYKLSVLISGNEEGNPINGMQKFSKWLESNKFSIDACILGEPTNSDEYTRTIKNGRRGSINFELMISGIQGHVAYPKQADNPITTLASVMDKLKNSPLDSGSNFFQPSNLEFTNINVGNNSTNVIPEKTTLAFNIRINNLHTIDSIIKTVTQRIDSVTKNYDLKVVTASESFLNNSKPLIDILSAAIFEVEKISPILSTGGGISDARFIKDLCPVIEYGLINQTAHKVDEYTTVGGLNNLRKVYCAAINNFFNL